MPTEGGGALLATAALVRHLHAKGYKNIAFIGGTSNRDTRGADRRRGYSEAIKALDQYLALAPAGPNSQMAKDMLPELKKMQ